MTKLKIGLLFGGKSGEHQVSITSARAIALGFSVEENREKYEVIPLYIDQAGNWWGKEVAEGILKSGEPKPVEKDTKKNWHFPEECGEIEVFFPDFAWS